MHRFPVDRIKVDRSFLLRARTEHETDVVMRAIIDLGTQLGLEVVAEGVETDVELAKLQAIGCKLGQGYLFAPPRVERQRAAALPWSGAGGVSRTVAPGRSVLSLWTLAFCL